MTSRKRKKEVFFLNYNIVILSITILGFGINSILNYNILPPISTLVIIHSLGMFGWYLLVVFQSLLIKKSNYKTHKNLGKISIVLAMVIIISGFLMTYNLYMESRNYVIFTVNLFLLINFAILYTLALYYRKSPNKHKRLIIFAGLSMMIPALARVSIVIGSDPSISFYLLLILLVIPGIYDYKKLKKIHAATIIGITLNFLGYFISSYLNTSEKWILLLETFRV